MFLSDDLVAVVNGESSKSGGNRAAQKPVPAIVKEFARNLHVQLEVCCDLCAVILNTHRQLVTVIGTAFRHGICSLKSVIDNSCQG